MKRKIPIDGFPMAFWKQVSNAAEYLKPLSQQQQPWQDLAPESEIIVYCGSGVIVCVNFLSLNVAGVQSY
ncbi:MAG: hypothetical protein AAFQ80_14900 [Cyanobacteria bacterium J06621_8]